MPTRNHGAIEMNLGLEFSKHREFRVLAEVTYQLVPGKRLTPDLSVESRNSLNLLQDTVYPTAPPLLVVEIVSPSQALDEIIDKVQFYLANDVKSVWMIIPPLHLVTIFLPDGSQESHRAGVVRDPATGLTADLDAVFS